MKHRVKILAAVAMIAAPLPVVAVGVQLPYWSAAAVGCTPDSEAIQEDRYQIPTDTYVTMRRNGVDPVVLICGVAPNAFSEPPTQLSMTYRDSTGSATKATVKATFIAVSRNTGARTEIATISSDSLAATSTTQNGVSFTHELSFDTNYYYVRIDMDRKATNQDIRSFGVSLDALLGPPA